MSESDGSHSCQRMTQESSHDDLDDPDPRKAQSATREVIGRFSIPV
jgi:hypothetical protein